MSLKIVFHLLLSISFVACQSSDHDTRTTTPLTKNTTSVKKEHIPAKEEMENDDNDSEKSVFRYYDEVYEQTIAWNKAIDEQDKSALKKVYANHVEAYSVNFSKSNLIKEKMNWLAKHPNYRQKIENRFDVFFRKTLVNGEEKIVYGSAFTKVTIENGKEKKYPAELLFKEENGKLKINVETDLISLLNVENQTKGTTLPDGKYNFETHTFYDTRREEDFAHEQARVSSNITFEIKNGQIVEKLGYEASRYSGYLRGITKAMIVKGAIEDDKIYLETVYYSDRDDYDLEYLKKKERDYTTIKVISKDKILILKPKQGQTIPLTVGDYLYRYPKK